MISATYDDFLSAVAKGRSMSKEAVRAVAKGRVWSGAQAMEVGTACCIDLHCKSLTSCQGCNAMQVQMWWACIVRR
jgi:hypothetical protein